MTSNVNVDLPKRKIKYTKAMVYRSQQNLKNELKSIDAEYSKSFSDIQRDLVKVRDDLLSLRVSQRRTRRSCIGGHQNRRLSAPGLMAPNPPLKNRARAVTMPFDIESSLQQGAVRSRRRTATKQENKVAEACIMEEKQFEDITNDSKTNALDKSDALSITSRAIPVHESVQLDGDNAHEGQEAKEKRLGTSIHENREDLVTDVTVVYPGETGNENDGCSQKSGPGCENEVEAFVTEKTNDDQQVVRNSSTVDYDSQTGEGVLVSVKKAITAQEMSEISNLGLRQKPEVTGFASTSNIEFTTLVEPVFNQIQTGLTSNCTASSSSAQNVYKDNSKNRSRRASAPNILFRKSLVKPVLNQPKTSFTSSLTGIQEVANESISNGFPSRQGMLIRRASSPDIRESTREKSEVEGEPSLTIQDQNRDTTVTSRPKLTRRASSPDIKFTGKTELTPDKVKQGSKEKRINVQELSQGNSFDFPLQRRNVLRRASTPNLTNLMFTSKTQYNDRNMNEFSQADPSFLSIPPPSGKPGPRSRRSSIAVMTGVSNPLGARHPDPVSIVRGLPDIKQNFGGLRKNSVQANQLQDSLRKNCKRMPLPLRGLSLQQRLWAHDKGSMSAVAQTNEARTPEQKAPQEMSMSDLEGCRYIRRRIRAQPESNED